MPLVVVFDTNILLSALFSLRGSPFRCLTLANMGRVQSVTCREILEEFREKLLVKFTYSSQSAQAALDEVQKFSRLVTITGKLKAVSADPDDDMVLECALVGGATYIVTGDRHLLSLGSYQGILIVKATDFLATMS